MDEPTINTVDDPTLTDMQEMEKLSIDGWAFTYTKMGWHYYDPRDYRHSSAFPTAEEMLARVRAIT